MRAEDQNDFEETNNDNLDPSNEETASTAEDSEAPSPEPITATDSTPEKPKKKGKGKVVLLVILVVILGGGGLYGYKYLFPESSGPRINPLNLVPDDAFFIMETDRPYTAWRKLSDTRIWKTLAKDEDWKEYGETLEEVENSLADFDRVLDVLSNRTVYISGHIYRKGDYDFLFVLDTEGLGVLRTWMTSQENLTKRDFQGTTIYEQLDPASKETLYFTFVDGFMVGSYTHTLVEASVSGFEEANLSRSFEFIEVRKKVLGEGIVRLYLNYETLYPYLESVMGEEYTQIMKENLPLFHSGFYFDIDQETLFLEGHSNYNDSLSTYLNIFKEAGTGSLDIAEVIPARTSVFFSLGFDSFSDFYEALDNQLREDPEYGEDYALYTKRTEKFLDVDLKEDFASWIDDEIAVIQLESENDKAETALIFKAKDGDLATEKMNFLSRQIKRKTPVKFKMITYKGYPINFMSVKGLFNLVLGNLFKYFDRPYYTIIDEYVIFSNEPQTLRRIINDYLVENTLANLEPFQNFKDQLDEEHSALLYLQLPLLERTKGGMMDEETASLLREKRALVADFPQVAFKIYPSRGMFQTKSLLSIDNVKLPAAEEYDIPFVADTINYDSLWKLDPGEQIAISELDFEIDDLGAKKQSEEYEDGQQKYEVGIKDGLKHGDYFEYHETGELKIKGKYKNDLKEGTWKYYDETGHLVKRERYKKGELQ